VSEKGIREGVVVLSVHDEQGDEGDEGRGERGRARQRQRSPEHVGKPSANPAMGATP